ncbi:hypothetical protein [Saccharomonospora xinjiangensis]|uniref:Uncharacterized protein n=1 Tax=Saccharomonospora xinjiangensis XJ-54 TaxID=882086 RepID=I0V3I7_9PSEU|nr:hypothetical protein [Saccharomonospora xinjiangensis]EID54690.1 hypothetical protein SacxiDRAFT_2467 [Saccharomonospora xinjiangensis XJ-54]
MEAWRILAAALLVVPGVIGILLVMAKARERTGESSAVAVTGLVALTALVVAAVLTLTVLPVVVTWVLSGAVALTVSVLALAS